MKRLHLSGMLLIWWFSFCLISVAGAIVHDRSLADAAAVAAVVTAVITMFCLWKGWD